MCGIAGIIKFNEDLVRKDELKLMTGAMFHRGPDDDGFFISGSIGLGMRRLSIIDLDGGSQPISNEDGTIWVVMNGEIYNYRELRDSLRKRGHKFKTESDTEVIVHLYEEKGVGAIDELNGMFSIALWDSRKKGLWLSRDRFGIKPLYISQNGKALVFASDLQAIRAINKIEISRDSVIKSIVLSYVPGPDTIYNGVKKMLPGTYLWIQHGHVRQHVYWMLRNVSTWIGSVNDAKEQLYEALKASIQLQLQTDVPFGIFLSGGVDSSAIVAASAKLVDVTLNTFTVNYTNKGGSEDSMFARIIAEKYKTNHCEVDVDASDAANALLKMLQFVDEPIYDSAFISTYILSKKAREAGIKVILNGAGADEIFGGYARHWPARLGRPDWFIEKFPKTIHRAVGSLWQVFQPDRGLRLQDASVAWGSGISGISLHTLEKLINVSNARAYIADIFRVEYSDLEIARQRFGFNYGGMYVDLNKYLVNDVLSLCDKATMAASVEGRVPFLDNKLVDLAFSFPPSVNLNNSMPKALLKKVLNSYLPMDLIGRKKEGFSAPMQLWIQQSNVFNVANELGNNLVPVIEDIINVKALRCILKNKNNSSAVSETLFSLFILNQWCRTHSHH
jgi:asparagine synthase (glutamine-hydrolysing)